MSDFVFYPKLQGGNDSGGLACHVVAEPVSRARWRESDKVYSSTGGMLSSRSTQMTHSGKRDQAVKLPIHVLWKFLENSEELATSIDVFWLDHKRISCEKLPKSWQWQLNCQTLRRNVAKSDGSESKEKQSIKMLDLFYQFTHFLKIQESVTIDNNVFRLHYKVSFNALF